uniref:ATP synthase complex subunit 8 n=1 Tax=Triatoma huehuetenanguensis TaxID=2086892 RepID=A0A7D7JVT3_9HEMI|nr:ATP synthase F0 subunit 8 [Triatoma huehuetenanguensis]QMP96784.1 ATP synthase F0 subunit 8 [Triatoma huehuetenanguensis]
MPQMAPAWWTTLYFMFILSFLIMCFLLYYHTYFTPQTLKGDSMIQPKINWKW